MMEKKEGLSEILNELGIKHYSYEKMAINKPNAIIEVNPKKIKLYGVGIAKDFRKDGSFWVDPFGVEKDD